jgi:pyruvate/2-oxoglutarate dehydrogenase complex dihydrolipoamide acyltransferase (E2) component
VEANPEANSILFRTLFGLRIVHFDSVDVNLPITREVEGRRITFIATVREAGRKSLGEIQHELSHHERCEPEESFYIRRLRQFSGMPLWLAQLVHRRMTWDPGFYTRNVGTCGLTLAEGDWFEHGFPIGPTTAIFGIGGARREPVVRGDAIVAERILHATLMADNYVVSGLTGAKLIRDFKELLESGSFIEAELAGHSA